MYIKQMVLSDLHKVRSFFAKYRARTNYLTVREDFFTWQYMDVAEVVGAGKDYGTLMLVEHDEILSVSLAAKTLMYIEGHTVPGAWHQEWYTDERAFGVGFLLFKEQLKRNNFLGVSGQSLSAANVFSRLRKVCWFELARLFVVINPHATFDLLLSRAEDTLAFLDQHIEAPATEAPSVWIEMFDEEYEKHWYEIRKNFSITTDRTSAYMNWRYVKHPYFQYQTIRYETSGGPVYFVWRLEQIPERPYSVVRICEVLGQPDAVTMAFPVYYHELSKTNAAFADFFCSNADLNVALLAAGMRYAITLPDFDLPRLFSPVANDIRKTINFAYSVDDIPSDSEVFRHHRAYFTKGDTNQDRPNL